MDKSVKVYSQRGGRVGLITGGIDYRYPVGIDYRGYNLKKGAFAPSSG